MKPSLVLTLLTVIWMSGCASTMGMSGASMPTEEFQTHAPPKAFVKTGGLAVIFPDELKSKNLYAKSFRHSGEYLDIDVGAAMFRAVQDQASQYFTNVYLAKSSDSYPYLKVVAMNPSLEAGQLVVDVVLEMFWRPGEPAESINLLGVSSVEQGGGAVANAFKTLVLGDSLDDEVWRDSQILKYEAVSDFTQKLSDYFASAVKAAPASQFVVASAKSSAMELQASSLTSSQKRTALVIGNSAYKSSPLSNPQNDAQDLARTLSGLGFKVFLRTNSSLKEMEEGIRLFSREIAQGGVGLFYFAGHGVQIDGENYLIPTSNPMESAADVKYSSISVNRVMEEMGLARNGLNIVILDACRNNPFPSMTRAASRGLARKVNAPRGTFVAYSTEPGNVSSDGDGRNGLYTKHLLSAIRQPNRELELVFKDVLRGVKQESKGSQVPWTSSSFDGEFVFSGQ